VPDDRPFSSQVRAWLRRLRESNPAATEWDAIKKVHEENLSPEPAPEPLAPNAYLKPFTSPKPVGSVLPSVLPAPPPKLADLPTVRVYIPPLSRTAKAVICAGCGFIGTEHNVFFRYDLGLCPPCRRKAKYYVRKTFGRLSGAALLRELHVPKPQPKPKGVAHA
jgi:hypothetical protein